MRLLLLSCCLGLVHLPQLAAEQWLVPGATNATAGNGLHYATDLKVYNQGALSASVALDLVTQPGEPAVGSAPQLIAPGQTLVLTNVLQSVWGLTERSGAVRVTADQQLVIAANVYSDTNDAGSYGFELEAIPYERWTAAGSTVHSAWISQSADPGAGFTTVAGLVLAAPNSAVDMRVFDAAGNQLARKQFSGGPSEQRVALNSLAAGDLAAGRVEFYVTSGRALAYALVTDNITGDTLISSGLPDLTQPVDVALNGMMKASTTVPQTAQSDLRIFNLSPSQPASVALTVLSSTPDLAGRNAFITVPAGQIQEIPDVLGKLFQAPEGTAAALRIQSAQPVIALARTARINTDGSPGTFGALQTPVALVDFLQAGDFATLPGLRADTGDTGTATTISLLAGAGGASANLALFGPGGESLGSATMSLTGGQQQDTALADLFAGMEIPDDARLEIEMTAGALSGFARAVDIASGDTWIVPATTRQPYICPAPSIVSFVVYPNSLAAAGRTNLYWSAMNADAVTITPAVTSPLLSGNAQVPVSATTSFTLTATGACGTVSQSATVAVGAPAIASLSPPSAVPGQIVTLKLRNVADPSAILQVNVTFSRSLTLGVRIEAVTPAGDVTFRVPFVGDTTDPAGHLTGAITIALALPGAATTGTALTILPLKYTGSDVTSDLRSLTNAAVLLVKSQLNAQQQVPEFAKATPALLAAVDRYSGVLNKLAADIAASGTASLPMVPPAGSAPSNNVTITRKQLETFFALYYSRTGAPPGGLPPAPAGFLPRAAGRRDASSANGPCLADNAAYKSCLDVVGTDPFEPFQSIFLELIQQSSFGNCTFAGLNATIAIIDSYLSRLFHFPLFNCYTQPTEIASFKAQPAPDPIPVGTRNGGTLITARLQSLFTPGSFAVAPFGEALLALNTLPPACQSQIQNSVIQAFDTINAEATQIVKDLVNSGDWKIAPSADVPVYKCDIDDLVPDDPSRIGRRPDWDNDPALRFGLEGFKAGPAPLKVLPKAQHFMRLDDWDTKRAYRTRYLEQDPQLLKIVRISVNVAGGKKLVVDGSLQNIGPLLPSAATSPNQVVVPAEDFSVPVVTGNFGGGAAYESHSVTQVNDTTWQIQIAQGGYSQGRASVNFVNPQNRNNTQHIIIQANAAGVDCGMYFTAGARGPNGNLIGPSYNVLHVDPQSYTIDAPGAVAGAVLLEIDGVTGGSCVANATIQLLDQ